MSDSIKKKIAALLAKAEGTDNEFEAATFMAKVNELLEKHQVEMHEVRAMGDNDPLSHMTGEFKCYASMSWIKLLAHNLAMYYGCSTIWTKHRNHFSYIVVGRQSARETFELMLPFVVTQLRRAATKLTAEHNVTLAVAQRQVAHALTLRVHALNVANEKVRSDLVGKGLIPVTDVQAYMDETFSNLRAGKARKVSTSTAAREHADKISLSVQATGKHVKVLK
ncbi:protein of unknown function DUF2786 [Rhizobium phage RHph_X3_2]|nr:protein of unknown function DUF2786 [Rhizobium phage RHph_X3_2]